MAWKDVSFGEVASIRHGWPFKSEYFSTVLSGRPIVVSIGNFRYTGGFRFESTELKEYCGEYPTEYELNPGDILLVMTCQTPGGEILGIPACVPNDGRRYLHNQRLGKLLVHDKDVADPRFLYWLCLSREFNQELFASSSGTKIVHTAPVRIEAFRFLLPTLSEQRAIAKVLDALDDKIELNRRMNKSLEELAQSVFRSWFVDFDPVTAKAAGRPPFGLDPATAALFPSEFQDSELGPIPKGWRTHLLEDAMASIIDYRGKTPRKTAFGVPLITAKIIKNGRIEEFEEFILPDDYDSWMSRGLPQAGDVVMTTEAPLGEIAQLDKRKVALAQRVITLRGKPSVLDNTFLRYLMQSSEFQNDLQARGSGTTVIGIRQSELRRITLSLPPIEQQNAFSKLVVPMTTRIDNNWRECERLAAARDALLPPLLSGELRIKNAEKLLEKVL